MTPDVNVLVASFRPDHPHHAPARAWLNDAVHQAAFKHAPLLLLGMVVTGFVRVTTNPRVFKQIDALQDVTAFVDTLLACPGVDYQPTSAGWSGLRDLCLDRQAGGNLVADAWIAATVMQTGETLCTFDRDFTRLLPADRLQLIKA